MTAKIPLHRPWASPNELAYVTKARAQGALAGNGAYAGIAERWLVEHMSCGHAFLSHSCTAALEMAALLADVRHGDEVILPSFTFPSTANSFVLRGATPVFVDIRPDTLNLDERLVESAVNARTRAIVPVHYAGVACEMETIGAVARRHGLLVVEDAAHGLLAAWRDRPLGSLGALAALSFHVTKNVTCGEGGALLVNDERFVRRAEIIREKGTDRSPRRELLRLRRRSHTPYGSGLARAVSRSVRTGRLRALRRSADARAGGRHRLPGFQGTPASSGRRGRVDPVPAALVDAG
jgi:dTDP-4-amino-4,6-dideoxygalactose transaminase